MKKQFLTLLILLSVAEFTLYNFSSCKSKLRFKDALAYHDSIVERFVSNSAVLAELDAKVNGNDFEPAQTAWDSAYVTLKANLEYIKGIGDFEGDDDFHKASVTFFKLELERMNGYVKLLDMVKEYGNDFTSEELEDFNKLYNKLHQEAESSINAIQMAQKKFVDKNSIVILSPDYKNK